MSTDRSRQRGFRRPRTATALPVLAALGGLTAWGPVAADDVIGLVLANRGEPTVERDGEVQPLTRRDEIRQGDILRTDERSRLEIRLQDDQTLRLAAGTTLKIEAYEFDEETGEGESRKSLVAGGLRAISGRISGEDNYSIETDVATIGIRGTISEVVHTDDAGTSGGTPRGAGYAENRGENTQRVNTGDDAPTDYFRVADADSPPEALAERPAELDQLDDDPEEEEEDEDEDTEEEEDADEEEEDDGEEEEDDTDEDEDEADEDDADEDDAEEEADDGDPDDDADDEPADDADDEPADDAEADDGGAAPEDDEDDDGDIAVGDAPDNDADVDEPDTGGDRRADDDREASEQQVAEDETVPDDDEPVEEEPDDDEPDDDEPDDDEPDDDEPVDDEPDDDEPDDDEPVDDEPDDDEPIDDEPDNGDTGDDPTDTFEERFDAERFNSRDGYAAGRPIRLQARGDEEDTSERAFLVETEEGFEVFYQGGAGEPALSPEELIKGDSPPEGIDWGYWDEGNSAPFRVGVTSEVTSPEETDSGDAEFDQSDEAAALDGPVPWITGNEASPQSLDTDREEFLYLTSLNLPDDDSPGPMGGVLSAADLEWFISGLEFDHSGEEWTLPGLNIVLLENAPEEGHRYLWRLTEPELSATLDELQAGLTDLMGDVGQFPDDFNFDNADDDFPDDIDVAAFQAEVAAFLARPDAETGVPENIVGSFDFETLDDEVFQRAIEGVFWGEEIGVEGDFEVIPDDPE